MKATPLFRVAAIGATLLSVSPILSAQTATPVPQPAALSDYPEHGMVPEKRMLHIGIVVRDIEKAREHWVKFLGLEELPDINIARGDPKNPTEYRGQPSTAQAKLVFMNLENLQVELIEPIGDVPSSWGDHLDAKGEGVHHIAFFVRGMGEAYLEKYAEAGCPVVQHGGWATGEYGYMDTAATLGVIVELIESYTRK